MARGLRKRNSAKKKNKKTKNKNENIDMGVMSRLQTPDSEYVNLILEYLPIKKKLYLSKSLLLKNYKYFSAHNYSPWTFGITVASIMMNEFIKNTECLPKYLPYGFSGLNIDDDNLVKLSHDCISLGDIYENIFKKHKYHLIETIAKNSTKYYSIYSFLEYGRKYCIYHSNKIITNKDLFEKYGKYFHIRTSDIYKNYNDSREYLFEILSRSVLRLGKSLYVFGPNFYRYLKNKNLGLALSMYKTMLKKIFFGTMTDDEKRIHRKYPCRGVFSLEELGLE